MAGKNTTGKPRTQDYNLGRGVVYFAPLDSTTLLPTGFRDLGNAPEFNISIEVETLEHQSSRQGLKITDKQVTISQKVNLSLTLDEINFENMASFFSGEIGSSVTNPAVAGITERVLVPTAEVELGRWYLIRNASGARVVDIDVTKLTVQSTDGTPQLFARDTDYEVDAKWGRIFVKSDGAIETTDGLEIILTADAGAAASWNEVKALTQTAIQGALMFISENPANDDEQTEFLFHQVSLKSDGDFSLIGDEYTQMSFTAVAERNESADSDSPTLTIRHYAQT